MANFPNSYDDKDSIYQDLADLVVLQLTAAITNSSTTISVSEVIPGALTRLQSGSDLVFSDGTYASFEIVKVTGKGTGTITVTRGQYGTTATSHSSGVYLLQDPLAQHFNRLRDAIIATERFFALLSQPANPQTGQIFIDAASQSIKYYTEGAFRKLNNGSHGEYAGLNNDDHPQYYNQTRFNNWHNAIEKKHISSVAHYHTGGTDGAPVRRLRSGTLSILGLPTNVGDVFYATDTGDLYLSKDGANWSRLDAVPTGTILFFESSCPPGWSRITSHDGYFLMGGSNATTTKSPSHSHSVSNVPTHTHSISATSQLTTSTNGDHSHTYPIPVVGTGYGSYAMVSRGNGNQIGGVLTSYDGDHSHTITQSGNTDTTGTTVNTSTVSIPDPPFVSLIMCQKG